MLPGAARCRPGGGGGCAARCTWHSGAAALSASCIAGTGLHRPLPGADHSSKKSNLARSVPRIFSASFSAFCARRISDMSTSCGGVAAGGVRVRTGAAATGAAAAAAPQRSHWPSSAAPCGRGWGRQPCTACGAHDAAPAAPAAGQLPRPPPRRAPHSRRALARGPAGSRRTAGSGGGGGGGGGVEEHSAAACSHVPSSGPH